MQEGEDKTNPPWWIDINRSGDCAITAGSHSIPLLPPLPVNLSEPAPAAGQHNLTSIHFTTV